MPKEEAYYQYRLKVGAHVQAEPTFDSDGQPVVDKDGNPVTADVMYDANDRARSIVVANKNLVERFGNEKFEKLDAGPVDPPGGRPPGLRGPDPASGQGSHEAPKLADPKVETTEDDDERTMKRSDLEAKTVQELKDLAEELEIDLGTAHRKDEIINTILAETP